MVTRYRIGYDRYGIFRYEDDPKPSVKALSALVLARRDPAAAFRTLEPYLASRPDDLAAIKVYVDTAGASNQYRHAYDVLVELRMRHGTLAGPSYGLSLIGQYVSEEVPIRHRIDEFPLLAKRSGVILQDAFRMGQRRPATEIAWSDAHDLPQIREYWQNEARIYGKNDPRKILMYAAFLTIPPPVSFLVVPLRNGKTRQVPNPFYANYKPDYAEAIRQATKARFAGVKAPIADFIIGISYANLGKADPAKAAFMRYTKAADQRDPRVVAARRYLTHGTLQSMVMPLNWLQKYYF